MSSNAAYSNGKYLHELLAMQVVDTPDGVETHCLVQPDPTNASGVESPTSRTVRSRRTGLLIG